MLEEDLEVAIKMVVVGNGAVGKSSMIQRYCKGIFTKDYKKTIGVDFLERQIQVNDEDVRLMLWDTAGQEEFDAITKAYYRVFKYLAEKYLQKLKQQITEDPEVMHSSSNKIGRKMANAHMREMTSETSSSSHSTVLFCFNIPVTVMGKRWWRTYLGSLSHMEEYFLSGTQNSKQERKNIQVSADREKRSLCKAEDIEGHRLLGSLYLTKSLF
nr:ras-related protein Rab-23 isoform X5 [Oryctolagus cuniculus]